jgi:16S rRNA processing protein RimM
MKRAQNSQNRFRKVGFIASAHGVRGQVKIRCFLDSPEELFACHPLHDHLGGRHFKLTRYGIQKELVIAAIEGVTDRNEAERLKGTELYTPALPDDTEQDNQWSYADLTGLQARLRNGSPYGTVSGVFNFGAGDILEIETADGRTEMLPFRHAYVGDIDVEAGVLVVFPPDYLEPEGEFTDEEP